MPDDEDRPYREFSGRVSRAVNRALFDLCFAAMGLIVGLGALGSIAMILLQLFNAYEGEVLFAANIVFTIGAFAFFLFLGVGLLKLYRRMHKLPIFN